VRLQLHALAYNLANFLRTLAHDVHGQDGRELAIHARSGHDSLREIPQNVPATAIFNPGACAVNVGDASTLRSLTPASAI
jgi:hypothetical protein